MRSLVLVLLAGLAGAAAAATPAPTVFALGVISGPADDADPAFSADGRTVVFSTDRASRPHYPRTAAQAQADQARAAAWDNGRQNIWSVPLDEWLRERPAQGTR